jgi:hypothetical protein
MAANWIVAQTEQRERALLGCGVEKRAITDSPAIIVTT